jgi:uracil-DNA glycosylase family protein
MGKAGAAEKTLEFLPDELSYRALKAASMECRGCDLYKNATQTVFGEGRISSGVIFVGEQPGDEEDLTGRPFVGPAGRLFDKALAEAGIDREKIYLTNTVKHFKWKPKGKRRIHEKPNASEINACDPWLRSEITLIKPRILVCLGATAAQALLGKQFRVTQMRGKWLDSTLAKKTIATIHPSAILRTPDDLRDQAYSHFVSDLVLIAEAIDS